MAKWHFGTYFWPPPEDYFLVASSATGLYGVFGRITFWSLKMPQNHCFHGIWRTFWVVQASPEVSMVIPQIPSASQKQVILGFWVSFWSVFYWFLLISYWILLPGPSQDPVYPSFDCPGGCFPVKSSCFSLFWPSFTVKSALRTRFYCCGP